MTCNGDYSPLSIKLPCKIIGLCLFSFSIFATDWPIDIQITMKNLTICLFSSCFPTNQGVFVVQFNHHKWWVPPLKKPHSQVGALDLEASSRWGKGKGRDDDEYDLGISPTHNAMWNNNPRWWQLTYFCSFHPENWGKIPKFDVHSFQIGWNHQPESVHFYEGPPT